MTTFVQHVFSILFALSMSVAHLHAVEPEEVLDDPALEERAREISAELRCLVCQNQSIDDSDAPLAKDLRILVRERLTLGESNEEIYDYLISRYGEFVLLRPRIGWHTAALWAAPVIFVGLGLAVVFSLRRQQARQKSTALTADEEARIRKLLDDSDR